MVGMLVDTRWIFLVVMAAFRFWCLIKIDSLSPELQLRNRRRSDGTGPAQEGDRPRWHLASKSQHGEPASLTAIASFRFEFSLERLQFRVSMVSNK
jgi:hypothetical protein